MFFPLYFTNIPNLFSLWLNKDDQDTFLLMVEFR